MDFDLGLEGFEMEEVFEATILGVLGRSCPQSVPVSLTITATLIAPAILSYHNFWLAPLKALSAFL